MNIAFNTAIRTTSPGNLVTKATPFVLPLPEFRILSLLLGIILSALALVYLQDLNRRLFIKYQDLKQTMQRLEAEHSALMLEKSALTTPARIQQIATDKWEMEVPSSEEVILLDR